MSIQWPIHVNANCHHLNGAGQHVESERENAFNKARFMDAPYNAPDSTALGQRSVFSLRVLSCFQLVRLGLWPNYGSQVSTFNPREEPSSE